MTLLVEVMEKPLDPGYAEAARRREAGQRRPSRPSLFLLGLVAVLLGLMTVLAAQQLRVPAQGLSARELLADEITDRQAEAEALRDRSVALNEEIDALQADALAGQDQATQDQMLLDAVVTGSMAVTGPGLEVTMTDGGADLGEDADASDARVQAVDLQTVVNALWASGAEAISVGDQRLTSLSAIRHAGEAVMVDLVPLPGPSYVVRAVGDPEEMQAAYARTGAPAYTQLLSSGYGITTTLGTASELTLPSIGNQLLRYAEPMGKDPSDDSTPEENS